MITCHECRNYIGLVCAECKGFDKFEVETDEAKQAMRKYMKYRGEVENAKKLFEKAIEDSDNVVYTISDTISFDTEADDIKRTIESLEKYKKDMINKPPHYADRKFETIDVIEDCIKANKLDGYQGYLLGNIIKYISRANVKGEMLDNLKKAQWYLNRLIEVREHEKVHG